MALFRTAFRPRPGPGSGSGSGSGSGQTPPSGPAAPAAARGPLRRFLLRNRRLLAAACFCAAAGLAVQALAPPEREYRTVLAARSDLPAGTVLQASALITLRLPAEALPPGWLTDPGAAAGRRLAHPLPGGAPVTESVLVGPGLLRGTPEGTAAVPVRPADQAAAQLLRPGELVDVVESGEPGFASAEAPRVLARDLPVLWTGSGSAGGGPAAGPWGGGDGDDAGLVVLAVPAALSAELSAASARGGLSLVLTGSG